MNFKHIGILLLLPGIAFAAEPFRMEVVEEGSHWPVPLVQFETVNSQRFVTDNAGIIAIDAPDLMGKETWFTIRGHGYGVKPDGFGMRGRRITPEPGKTERIEVERTIIAKRLGRLTGDGLFAESQRFGEHADWKDSGLVGQDSVQNVVHHGKLFWSWGDTSLRGNPLGLFHMTGATTNPPGFGGA